MPEHHPSIGISARTIMLFGLLALTVVLVDAIAILQSEGDQQQTGKARAISYCGKTHEKFPSQCPITQVRQCGQAYLLQSDCIGVGNIILSSRGTFLDWCGYNTLDTAGKDCGQYINSTDCIGNINLCI
jgi:hypothetical protein